MSRLLIIGPFPPPVHGFSIITKAFADAVMDGPANVKIADMAVPPTYPKPIFHILRLWRCIVGCWAILSWRFRGKTAVYIACNGGSGLAYTVLQLIVLRALGMPGFLHHHSFQYILYPNGLMRWAVSIGAKRLTHVFLCETMREKFQTIYGEGNAIVLENCAFVPEQPTPTPHGNEQTLKIGLLSNLCKEKGLYDFLDIMRQSAARDLQVKGVLAGPAQGADLAAIRLAQAELGDRLTYIGPVYGAEKDMFFSAVDVFTFPTDYVTEAQPTVIFEAQSFGCPVISRAAGCIAAQLGPQEWLIEKNADFVEEALQIITQLSSDRTEMERRQKTVWREYAARREQARRVIATLVEGL